MKATDIEKTENVFVFDSIILVADKLGREFNIEGF